MILQVGLEGSTPTSPFPLYNGHILCARGRSIQSLLSKPLYNGNGHQSASQTAKINLSTTASSSTTDKRYIQKPICYRKMSQNSIHNLRRLICLCFCFIDIFWLCNAFSYYSKHFFLLHLQRFYEMPCSPDAVPEKLNAYGNVIGFDKNLFSFQNADSRFFQTLIDSHFTIV